MNSTHTRATQESSFETTTTPPTTSSRVQIWRHYYYTPLSTASPSVQSPRWLASWELTTEITSSTQRTRATTVICKTRWKDEGAEHSYKITNSMSATYTHKHIENTKHQLIIRKIYWSIVTSQCRRWERHIERNYDIKSWTFSSTFAYSHTAQRPPAIAA